MATATATTPPAFKPGYRGFNAFCQAVGYQLEPFQRRIARAHFGAERECVAILPRGSAKSTLAAHLAVHHCLSRADPGVYIGAASREQARIIGAMVRALSRHRAIAPYVVWRTDALRWADDPKGPAILSVVASSGDKAHGWPSPTLIVADEIWSWSDREPTLLGAMMTAMLKVPNCRFLGISTAAASLDSPLGALRRRALAAPSVDRKGAVTEAGGDGLRWLEWSLAEDADHDDLRAVAACNPLRTLAEIREQRPRVTDVEWLQFHCCRWGVGSARWLPPGAWSACRAVYEVGDEPLVLGVDVGGSRSATAVVGVEARSPPAPTAHARTEVRLEGMAWWLHPPVAQPACSSPRPRRPPLRSVRHQRPAPGSPRGSARGRWLDDPRRALHAL